MSEGLALLPDRFGRNLTAFAAIITTPRVRRWMDGQRRFFHRPRNGAHDPLTQFHVLMAMLQLQPDTQFTARDLTEYLQKNNDRFSWDVVTVGRIVTDFADSISLSYPTAIIVGRRWDGTRYAIRGTDESREVLARLADDLYEICEETIQAEASGRRVSRLQSPLAGLPSLHGPTAG